MNAISIKHARQQFAQLVNSVQGGRTVALLRRGKAVAQITPMPAALRQGLPDLSAFRASLGKPAPKSKATLTHLRQAERY